MNCVFMIRFILKVQAIFCKKKSFKFLRPLQNPNEAFFGPKIMIVFIFHQLVYVLVRYMYNVMYVYLRINEIS